LHAHAAYFAATESFIAAECLSSWHDAKGRSSDARFSAPGRAVVFGELDFDKHRVQQGPERHLTGVAKKSYLRLAGRLLDTHFCETYSFSFAV
jgi:hypothetical protein